MRGLDLQMDRYDRDSYPKPKPEPAPNPNPLEWRLSLAVRELEVPGDIGRCREI